MRSLLLAGLIATSAACLSSRDVVVCDDGRVCPEGSTCTSVGSQLYCASPEQQAVCASVAEGAACEYLGVDSACHGGVCLPIACGNALIDPDEMCDDGNIDPFDDCSADCRSTRVCRNGVVDADADRREGCDDGNSTSHDGCATSCVAEALTWTLLAPQHPLPLSDTQLAYDSRRGRVVMFGGREGGIGTLDHNYTHEWDGARWVQFAPDVAPQPRRDYQIAFDVERGVSVMFSGSTFVPDTWLWDGLRWSVATPTTIPPPRAGSTLVYDSKRKRLVMFGGRRNTSPTDQFFDMWAWTGSDWEELKPVTLPSKREGAQVAYDPKRDRIVMFGGFAGGVNLADLWEFDGTIWTQKAFSGGPGARSGGGMAFDPVSEHVILIPVNATAPTDVWDWDGAVWTKRPLASSFPEATNGGRNAITTDTTRGRVVVWTDKIYELVGSTWLAIPGGEFDDKYDLGPRQLATVALDTKRRRVIAYGGQNISNVPTDETWLWDGSWDIGATGPSARFGAGGTFDRSRGEMLMFGGCPTPTTFRNDTYTFDTTWHLKLPALAPAARCKHAVAYDVAKKQVILFGGDSASGPLADTWGWDPVMTNWVPITTAHTPPARYGAAIGYDEERQQIVMFGGHGAGTLELEDTWVWDGTARDWIAQTVPTPPPHRHYAQIAWDFARRRLVLYGGADSNGVGSLGDVWEWSGTTWSLAPAQDSARLDSHCMTSGFDGGVVVFGGITQGLGVSDAVMRLRYDGPAPYETCGTVDVDGDGLTGCSDSDCAATCIPCGDGVCDGTTETCASCPADCGPCPATCGDHVCGSGEVCPGDC